MTGAEIFEFVRHAVAHGFYMDDETLAAFDDCILLSREEAEKVRHFVRWPINDPPSPDLLREDVLALLEPKP